MEESWEKVTAENEKIFKVGKDVLTYCGRCKMALAHVILAKTGDQIARVRCNTCKSEHNFKRPEGKSSVSRTKKATRKPSQKKISTGAYERHLKEQIGTRDPSEAQPYKMTITYKTGDMLLHPTFELGVVTEVLSGHKIKLVFKDGERILIHAR